MNWEIFERVWRVFGFTEQELYSHTTHDFNETLISGKMQENRKVMDRNGNGNNNANEFGIY